MSYLRRKLVFFNQSQSFKPDSPEVFTLLCLWLTCTQLSYLSFKDSNWFICFSNSYSWEQTQISESLTEWKMWARYQRFGPSSQLFSEVNSSCLSIVRVTLFTKRNKPKMADEYHFKTINHYEFPEALRLAPCLIHTHLSHQQKDDNCFIKSCSHFIRQTFLTECVIQKILFRWCNCKSSYIEASLDKDRSPETMKRTEPTGRNEKSSALPNPKTNSAAL